MLFEAEVVITQACNLACKYCYMENRPQVMTPEVFDSHVKAMHYMTEYYRMSGFAVSFFGGEPTTNWSLIEHAIPVLKNDPKCKRIMLITNGLLLDRERIEFLQQNGVGYSLSFDGMWNEHNRPLKSGGSSLQQYLEKKELLFGQGGNSKVMISPDSVPTLTENLEFLYENFGSNNPDYTLVRDDIWSEEDIALYAKEIRRLGNRIIRYWNEGHQVSIGLFNLYLMDTVYGSIKGKRPFGCFAGRTGAGFMPNGKVYPCARFGNEGAFELYNSLTGEENDENLDIMEEPRYSNPSAMPECKACELHNVCNAGCTYSQMAYGKKHNVKRAKPVDSVCRLYKLTYAEAYRVFETLRGNSQYINYIVNLFNNAG